MAAELYVLERQLSSLRNSVPEEVADAAREAKRQARSSVQQAMSVEAGDDVSGSAAAGTGLDEPAASGDSNTSAFSGITDALLSNPKFSGGAEGGSPGHQGSDRCVQCCRAAVGGAQSAADSIQTSHVRSGTSQRQCFPVFKGWGCPTMGHTGGPGQQHGRQLEASG